MKKFSINNLIKLVMTCFVITFLVVEIFNNKHSVFASSKPEFAQIKNSNTYLYKSVEFSSTSNKWCLIEKSYFVKILNNYNSEFYKVEYNGITGFVKKEEITLVNETPLVPYPQNITFSTNSTNCYLRSSPTNKEVIDNTLAIIPSNTKNLKYIGKIIGEEAVDFKGSIWYLTNYNGQIGYVYSAYTNSITPIVENKESVSIYTGNTFSKINPLSNVSCIVIIFVTLIPCVAILLLLYIPKKSLNVKSKPNSTKPNVKDLANFFDENL